MIDPYVLDRGVDRYGEGRRTLTDVARHYGVAQRGVVDALAEVETTLVPTIVERHPRLARMSLDALQDFQAETMREWAASLTGYLARQGAPRRVDGPGRSSPPRPSPVSPCDTRRPDRRRPRKDHLMAVHITIYPEEPVAAALRRFMAAHGRSPTGAVELLLAHVAGTTPQPTAQQPEAGLTRPAAA